MGILTGYRNTLNYLFGISTGFILMMSFCGLLSGLLLQVLAFEIVLRLLGAAYILWLAYHTFRASYAFEESEQTILGFSNGFLLQLLNPKLIVYGLTLYATFLSDIVDKPLYLFASALIFATVAFCSTSTWTLFGAAIRTYLVRPRAKQILNTVLSLLLVYTALELSGLFDLLAS